MCDLGRAGLSVEWGLHSRKVERSIEHDSCISTTTLLHVFAVDCTSVQEGSSVRFGIQR